MLGVIAAVLVGDFVYSRVVANRAAAWEETVDRDAGGVQLHCGAYTLGEGNTALLFVHGINDSPRCFDNIARTLAEKNFTCRVMRLPGFAEPLDKYAAYGNRDWIAAVDAELRSLRADHERVGVVAHSLGGAVTIGQLFDRPESADFAVLLAPAVAVSNDRSPVLSTREWHEVGRRILLFTRITWSPFDLDCHDPKITDYPGRTPFTPLVVVDELFELMHANRGRAGEFQTPLLMVLSKQDRVIDWQAAKSFFDAAGSSEKQLMFLDDSGHAMTVDYGWPRVADAIAEFAEGER